MSEEQEMVTGMEAPIFLQYNFTAGKSISRFLSALKQGKLLGMRCPKCSSIHIPPRGSCPSCGIAISEELILPDKATVRSFTIVHMPIPENPLPPPLVVANLIIDGSHVPLLHLLSECKNEEVRIGMRVQAVWKPQSEWTHALDNIRYFRPIGEPDMPVDEIGRLKDA